MDEAEASVRCYRAIVAELSDEERATVAEAASILASTADRVAQVEAEDGAEGMAVELRRIANEHARVEEIALGGEQH